jgi:hypothetical protein
MQRTASFLHANRERQRPALPLAVHEHRNGSARHDRQHRTGSLQRTTALPPAASADRRSGHSAPRSTAPDALVVRATDADGNTGELASDAILLDAFDF